MNNKKALSEIVSYVLFIVIAISLASGVYVWMQTLIPAEGELKECSDETSIIISDYNCNLDSNQITLILQNKGKFTIDGFFIRASNDSNNIPALVLESNDTFPGEIHLTNVGRYDFVNINDFHKLEPEKVVTTHFDYTKINKVEKIQIQPYVCNNRDSCTAILMCNNKANLDISPSSNCK